MKTDQEWKEYWLRQCYKMATRSPDPSNQNGAVILPNKTSTCYAHGINHIPWKKYDDPTVYADREQKYRYVEHAERSAIYNAIRDHIRTDGSILICPWIACGPCSRAIYLSGIKTLITHKQRWETTPERWKEDVEDAVSCLIDSGVTVDFVDAKLDCDPILVNGERWTP